MKKTPEQMDLEEKLILEEYDPETQVERAEDEQLKLEKVSNANDLQPTKIVKSAYGKIDNGHAIVKEHLTPLAIIVFCVFLAVPFLFLTLFIINEWWSNIGMIFACVIFSCASICVAYFIVYRGFIKNTKKLFDIYYFQQGKKRIIIYQNEKYTVYYRNRKELICIDNKTKKHIEDYERADFMNLKLGFNSLVGNLQYKKLKKGGFEIWTPARYDTSTQLHIFSGYASLTVDDNCNPIKVFIGGGKYTSYIYEFKSDSEFKVKIPSEMIKVCKKNNIEPPQRNQWLSYE